MHKEAALAYYENEQFLQAEDQALRGIDIDRDDDTLRLMLGWIHLRRGTTDSLYKARGVFSQFKGGDEPRADLGLGETLERLGRVHEETAVSIELGERFVKGDPEKAARERREEAREFYEQARESYARVLDAQPDNLKALNGMQRVHSLRGDYAESLAYAERLIEVASAERDALRTSLADPERLLTSRSEQNLREVARTTEDLLVETHFLAYSLELALSDREGALHHLDRTLELDPGRTEAWSRRAQLHFELGDFRAAIDDATEFVKRSPKPFDDPDIRRAWDIKHKSELALR